VLVGNAAKAKEKLGWTAETSLEDMVAEMVEADLKRLKHREPL
jgi:GDPmannose 4,6-dehydratase